MPTVAQVTFSASGRLDPLFEAEDAPQISVALQAPGSGTTVYQRGTVMGEVTASPGTYGPYASGHSDGTQNPAGLLVYTCTVDASGNISGLGEFSQTLKNTPLFMGGIFKTSELTGLDANAVTKLGGVLIEGSVTSGIFKF